MVYIPSIRVFILLGILCLPALAYAQKGNVQEYRGERIFGRDDSRARLEQQLLEEARRKVVEQEVGIKVQSTEQSVQGEYLSRGSGSGMQTRAIWVEDFISLSKQESSGRILQEDEPRFTESVSGESRVLRLHYSARVARDVGKRDPGFRVSFALNQDSYREGDTLRMTAQSERACWLYVFNVGRDGHFTLIWPNTYDRDHAVWPGRKQQIPSADHRYAFVAEINQSTELMPSGNSNTSPTSSSMESQTDLIFALFYLGERPLLEPESIKQGKEYTLGDFNRILLEIDLRDRREVAVAYTTTRKR